jgi:hypothetical protein
MHKEGQKISSSAGTGGGPAGGGGRSVGAPQAAGAAQQCCARLQVNRVRQICSLPKTVL